MQQYSTQQRKILLDFLESHSDESLSALEIIKNLSEHGISKSAVYRNLAALEEEGKVKRTVKTGERTSYYQYMASEHCKDKIHIHCIRCGKTSHISGSLAERIGSSIELEDDFQVDNGETVIYGICKDCKK